MTILRTLSIVFALALLLSGCSTTSCHKPRGCVYANGAACCDSAMPMPDPNAGVLLTPPARSPVPVEEAEPLREVPEPPGTTEAPSRLRAIRDTTEGLFRTAGENVRAVFTR